MLYFLLDGIRSLECFFMTLECNSSTRGTLRMKSCPTCRLKPIGPEAIAPSLLYLPFVPFFYGYRNNRMLVSFHFVAAAQQVFLASCVPTTPTGGGYACQIYSTYLLLLPFS
jgi:hypothetical protein